MPATDATDRIRPNDAYPYDRYSLTLKPKAHLHYAYSIRGDCI
jgi:hypothetical protein